MKSANHPLQDMKTLVAFTLLAATAYPQAVTQPASSTPETQRPTPPVETIASEPTDEGELVILSPFEVTTTSDRGYQATETLAGSRINTRLEDVGSAISVVTAQFLKDVGATDNKSLLMYTANTEVGGAQGNFRGSSGGQNEDESGRFTNPNGSTRVRGLTSADNTRNFFVSEIPWEGYNVERVDMQRGANAILFGLGSPAGIINATTKTAQHRNFREVDFRFGSYGSNRVTLDINQNIMPGELSLRLNLVRNDEQYRQDPAYSLDRRIFGTLRYDPKFLSSGQHKTTIKLNYEKGEIESNNPRTMTPRDQITQWWGALQKKGYDPRLVHNSGWFYDANGVPYRNPDSGQFNRNWAENIPNNPATGMPWTPADAGHPLPNAGSANPNYSPWLGAPSIYGGIWLQVNPGSTSPYSATMPEYKNIRGIGTTGAIDGTLGTPYTRRVNVASTAYWAERATPAEGAKYQNFGLWKAATLTDSSIFDFYNNLLDGDNKEEWQNFDNFNASLSQTFFNRKFGFDLGYDRQNIDRGQYSFDGAGVLYVDINTHNIDGTVNQNYGKPYTETNYLYGNNTYDSTRDASRVTAFFEHDFNKNRQGGFFAKLLGRHTIIGLLSTEDWRSDSRNFSRYGTPDDFIPLVANQGSAWQIGSGDRTISQTTYLGGSLSDRSSASGANISRANGKLQMPSSVEWRWFDSTWNAGAGVNPAATWTNPYNNATSTQSENPANYVGWSTRNVRIMSAEGDDQDYLTRQATLNRREVNSTGATWQGYLWDGALIGLYGLREDRVETWAMEGARHAVYDRVNFSSYTLDGGPSKVLKEQTQSWSGVAKLNQFLGGRLPINVNLFYNKSDNFQVTNARNDLYGQPLSPPSGEGEDMGIMLSTKDQRFFLKINKFESTVNNAGNSTINNNLWYLMGGDNFISRLESRVDAFQYHLKTRDDFRSINYLDDANPREGGSWGWFYSTRTGETQEHADLTRLAAVAAWRDLTATAPIQKILQAWGYPALNQNPLTQTAQATPSNLVANFLATEDQISKGWEIEFTANPTKNWRFTLNASESRASRSNVGGSALNEFVAYANSYHNKRFVRVSGPGTGVISVADGLYRDGTPGQTYYFREATAQEIQADRPNIDSTGSGTVNTTFGGIGNIPMWFGGGARNGEMVSWNSNFYSKYLLLKLQEGANTPELRRWRVNFVSNYSFTQGLLKGANVGIGYRWQDKIAIGYPVKEVTGGSTEEITFDIDNPYYGPTDDAIDLWVGYGRKLTPKINWRIQLNVRNVGDGKKLIPLSAQYDGTVAAWGIAPAQTWTISNTFSF
jgi:outer membrane receptor protein involved in Fe transport